MSGASKSLARRELLRVSALAGGGMLIALRVGAPARALSSLALEREAGLDSSTSLDSSPPLGADASAPRGDAAFAPNAFVRIDSSGALTVMINKAEMGQGVCTSLSMLVAEELDADWSRVRFEFAPVGDEYAHPGYGIQMTGGSTSVAGMSKPLREAGAAARALLVSAAAARWSVEPATCSTENGAVLHAPSGRRADYGELASSAAQLSPPRAIRLKDPRDYRLVGKPTHRLDSRDKARGTATFAIDVRVPGMLTALVLHPPVFGAKLVDFDASAASAIAGVRRIFALGDGGSNAGVAVVASGFWPAKRARDLVRANWDLGPNAELSSAAIRADYAQRARQPGLVARRDGDVDAALRGAARTLEADYELPYLAHATMEPLNCVADVRADRCEVWAGSQFQTVDRANAAAAAGLKPEQVDLHTTFLGGGFGRRANPISDYIVEAVRISKHVGAPIQLVWTREDDMRAGYYRPLWHSRVRAALDAHGAPLAWTHTLVGQSIVAGTPFEPMLVKDGIDHTSVEGAFDMHYAIPNVRVDLHTTKLGVPTLWWRSVGHSHTAFVVESFVDELAAAAGADPYELRRKLLGAHPRLLGVLERAAREAGWGKPLPVGHAHGIAAHFSFESYVAEVAEVSIENGRPRVHRVTCAVDCGRVVNPDTVRAQLEGAVGFGLTAALYGEISLERGRVQQSNFHDYRMLRIHEMPRVDVHIVASDEPSTGVGEPGVPPVAPALCNALFALTGKRIRRLPLRLADLADVAQAAVPGAASGAVQGGAR